jgi:hypothetical protein
MTARHQSFESRAKRRNTAIATRNQKQRDANPLFEHAGILDQVVQLDQRQWDALSLAYDELARGIASYERWLCEEREERQRYAIYRQMLCEAIGEENVEEVVADYDLRWQGHPAMQQWCYKLDFLCRYLATYLKRTPLDVYEEACRRCRERG